MCGAAAATVAHLLSLIDSGRIPPALVRFADSLKVFAREHSQRRNSVIIAKMVSTAALAALSLGGWKSSRVVPMHPDAPPVATITSHDYTFDAVADIPAGVVDLRLRNQGKDLHHAAIFKLASGKTTGDLVAALKNPGPPPSWATPVPGPNAPTPGEESNTIVALTPGNYALLCFVNTNGGVPHFMKGMVQSFKVVASTNSGRMPKADVKVKMFDYSFQFSKPVKAGAHTFRFTNIAKQPHEIELFQLAPGKTLPELISWLSGPMKSQPPAKPMGGVMNVPPGGKAEVRVTTTPGQWAAVCFIPDAKDGKPHFMKGMQYAFTVE